MPRSESPLANAVRQPEQVFATRMLILAVAGLDFTSDGFLVVKDRERFNQWLVEEAELWSLTRLASSSKQLIMCSARRLRSFRQAYGNEDSPSRRVIISLASDAARRSNSNTNRTCSRRQAPIPLSCRRRRGRRLTKRSSTKRRPSSPSSWRSAL